MVCLIIDGTTGIYVSIIVSFLVLAGWPWFNPRSGTTFLIKSIMNPYFVSRSRGATHEEALERVIKSRYPFSIGKQAEIKSRFDSVLPIGDEREALKKLVYEICCYEQEGELPSHLMAGVPRMIDDIYDSLGSRYGFKGRKGVSCS